MRVIELEISYELFHLPGRNVVAHEFIKKAGQAVVIYDIPAALSECCVDL